MRLPLNTKKDSFLSQEAMSPQKQTVLTQPMVKSPLSSLRINSPLRKHRSPKKKPQSPKPKPKSREEKYEEELFNKYLKDDETLRIWDGEVEEVVRENEQMMLKYKKYELDPVLQPSLRKKCNEIALNRANKEK